MEEVNVMIEDKEKVVKEKNSNQEQKQILNEYLMKYDIRAGQVIYWYFHSKHPRSKAIEERNFIAVAVALITKILSSIAYIAATYLIIYKYIEFIFITSNSENKNKYGFNLLNFFLMMVFGLYVELYQAINLSRVLPVGLGYYSKKGYAKIMTLIEYIEAAIIFLLTFLLLAPYCGILTTNFDIVLNGVALLFITDMDQNTISRILDGKLRKEIKLWFLEGSDVFFMCLYGYVHGVETYLKKKSFEDINKFYWWHDGERTLLMIACEKGWTKIVEILIDINDIDLNINDKHGKSALWYACENGHDEIVTLFLDEKNENIDINLNNEKQEKKPTCPLFIATFYDNINVVKLLLNNKNIDIDKKCLHSDGKLYTPIEIAIKEDLKQIVDVLQEKALNETNKI